MLSYGFQQIIEELQREDFSRFQMDHRGDSRQSRKILQVFLRVLDARSRRWTKGYNDRKEKINV